MAAWTVVPCLLTLREEFNRINPGRDKGADGTIGDNAHTSTSDHTPDEDSDILRDRDADSRNEVHALDIDSSGSWPESGWFGRTILALVDRERAEYESPDITGRLQYVIWNGRIASRSVGWEWRTYSGADPHTNHAHFSARYLSSTEADTRPWGVQEDIVTKDEIAAIAAAVDTKLAARFAKLDAADAADAGRDATNLLAQRQTAASVQKLREGLEGWNADQVAALIPDGLAQQVADILAARLAA